MAKIGYHASHEQFAPEELLELARHAEAAGFRAAMCSDHFHPWSRVQGHSGHAWCWLGAALASTALPFGVVTAPAGGRYHPAVLAQAAATLARMFPQRFWMAAGTGEALNEAVVGAPWPPKPARNERLREAVETMRALWRGEEVNHHGSFAVEQARLYTLPPAPPPVLVAALTPETARWGAQWADGLITISQPRDKLRKLVDAFREGGGEGKPMHLQVKLSYAREEAEALQGAYEQWRTNVFPGEISEDLRTPAQYEALAREVQPQDMYRFVRVSADPGRHLGWLQDDLALGFDHLYLHNVNRAQREFVEAFGERVLPELR
ncbi:TIGR03885 family FMN-dependent LLM class oxidoreductase [Vulcaniibacterium tengchongense]|uniref:Putative non-F420 flavinoid oxidoreductase n=1 Tax=Vulcaniibacterium tengchongense TaxID=1273429 RepID=A0A3N4VII9_9GAMM|nr:TIGR03885 family FMN-dependent LLM class oxidoreductase [Vulcaniibacterium tengchongense]RPE76907.1 putative non-F420 flavinoid oxidoreductase [Vulcaniibacterium tengchongense]